MYFWRNIEMENMNTPLIIIALVVGGVGLLATAIMAIVSLSTGKNNNALGWGAGFLVSSLILGFSVYALVQKVKEKVKDGVEWAMEQDQHAMGDEDGDNDQQNGNDPGARQAFLDTLQAYTNENYEGKVPTGFYTNKPADTTAEGKLILPFLYPYSISYNPNTFLGDIFDASTGKVYASNLSQMAFDRNFVIAKLDNTGSPDLLKSGHGDIEYILFDQRTGEYETFVNLAKLLEISGKIGYAGSQQMNFLSDDYYAWMSYPDYD